MPSIPIPENLDFVLYFNVLFFSILGLAMLFGFLRGFKKSLYAFLVTLVFYLVFFLTIDLVVNQLWTLELSFLGGILGNLDPSLSSASNLSEALPLALQLYLGDSLGPVLSNEEVLAFVAGIGLFVVKLVYTLLYFTIIQLIYRFLLFLIRIIFFPSKKSDAKYRSKNRGFGALFGLMSGAISVFVTLIILGGIMSISESLLSFAPEDADTEDVEMPFPRNHIYEANYSILPLAENSDPLAELGDAIAMLESMVTAFQTNIIVSTTSQVTITEETTSTELSLNLYLFDAVLSFDYDDNKIALRHELAVFSEVTATVMQSAFLETGDLSDVTGADIRDAFSLLSHSALFTSLLPVAIDAATDYFEIDLPVSKEVLYEIDWQAEVVQLGDVAALVFDFVNAAGLLDGDPNLETLVLDAGDVREIFTGLGNSQLVTLVASIAVMEPVLEQLSEEVAAIITVPADLNWEEEFTNIGEIIAQIIETGISFSDFESGDPMTIISALATLDFTVLLGSTLVKNALINVLSGAGGFINADQISFLVIPDDIDWDTELLAILEAINVISSLATQIDFNDFQIGSIAELDLDSIDAIFESRVLVASITKLVKEQDFGDVAVVIPDSVYDSDGYIKKSELINLVDAVKVIVVDLACDVGDDACSETGFDIEKALSLSSESVNTVLESDIIWATLASMIIDMGGDFLLVPSTETAQTLIMVEGEPRHVVSRLEIDRVFQAVSVLGITDINDVDQLDPSMVTDIAADEDKVATLLASEIIQATVGDLLYDMGSDVLTIPDAALTTVLVGDETYSIVEKTEIERLLAAVATLEIGNIEEMEIDPSILNNLGEADDDTILDQDKADKLFDSLIIHATLSVLLIDLGTNGTLTIPYYSEIGEEIRYENDVDEFEWISDTELRALIQAILILDIADFENLSIEDLDLDFIIDNSDIILDSSILQGTISKQIRELDAEMIVIPSHDLSGNPVEITQGEGEKESIYISKSELERTLDAINVLEIDMESPQFDATIIDHLAVDPLTPELGLDDVKLGILFDSCIIQASLSNMILDFTETDGETEAILVVPYRSEADDIIRFTDHGTDYISEAELIHLFKAVYSLDIDDFNSVDSLSLTSIQEHFSTLILSSTLHATISDQVMTLESDAIVIPAKNLAGNDTILTRGEVGFETTYITTDELELTFDALEVLNIDFNNPVFDATIIDQLAVDPLDKELGLDDDKLDTLFASTIIHASISKMLIDLTKDDGETEAVLVLPYVDVIGNDVRIQPYDTEFVTETELDHILNALYAMDIDDFNSVDALSLSTIQDNFDTLILSATLHATISDQVIHMESDAIVIPSWNLQVEPEPILIEQGIDESLITYISETELRATFDALEVLNIDFNNPVFDATIIDNLEDSETPEQLDDTKLDTLFDSTILHASISKMLIDLTEDDGETEAVLQVPTLDYGGNPVQFTDHLTEFVAESELRASFSAMHALDITDFNNIDSLTLSKVNQEFDTIILSAIIHATISDQMLTIESEDVDIPYFDFFGSSIRIDRAETTYILDSELETTFIALEFLGVNELNNVDININLTDFYTPDNRNILLASATIHSAISKQLIDLDDTVLEVPFVDCDEFPVLIEQGDSILETDTLYVSDTEIHALFEVMEILGISDLDSVDINLDLTLFYDDTPIGDALIGPRSTLLASASIHLEISKQLTGLGDAVLEVPFYDEVNTPIRILAGSPLDDTEVEYVVTQEIHALFEVMEALHISDLDNVNIDLDLSEFFTPEERQVLFDSASVQLEISKQLFGLGNDVLEIPSLDINDNSIRISRGNVLDETDSEYVAQTEIHALFEMLEKLNITGLDTVNIDLDLSQFFTPEDRQVLFDSASVHLEISKQLFGLGDDVLEIPTYREVGNDPIRITRGNALDETESEYVTDTEIHALFEVLEKLNITDLDHVTIDLDLSHFYTPEERQILFDSASVQLEISKQLVNLGDEVLEIPTYNNNDSLVRIFRGNIVDGTDAEYVTQTEIHALFEVLEALNISDLDNVTIDLDLSEFYTPAERQILLDSASVHLEISKQLFGLGDLVLEIPTYSEANDLVRVVHGNPLENTDSEYVTPQEIHALFEVLEALNISDLDNVTIDLDLTEFYSPSERQILLDSASVHLEISKQLFGLGDLVLEIPTYSEANDLVRVVRGNPLDNTDSEYVTSQEIHALFEVLQILNISDLDNVAIDLDLTLFYDDTPGEGELLGPRSTLMASAAVHLEISKQLLALGSDLLAIPTEDIDENLIRINRGNLLEATDSEYVLKNEIHALFEVMEVLGVEDINSFPDNFNLAILYDEADRLTMLSSASVHLTMSKQLLDLDDVQHKMIVPQKDVSSIIIRVEVTYDAAPSDWFVAKGEIHHFFEGLESLDLPIANVESFDGAFDMTKLYDVTTRNLLLQSGMLHATISNQLLDLDDVDSAIIVPGSDFDELLDVRQANDHLENFVHQNEIHAFFEAIEILGVVGDVANFSGAISLNNLFKSTNAETYQANQTTLLTSSIMHATISDQILALDGDEMIIPDADASGNPIQDLIAGTSFVYKTEIKHMIDAMDLLGVTDIQTYDGVITLDEFYDSDNQNLLLLSASMHATISDQILDLNATDTLIVPTIYYGAIEIRDDSTGTEFVLKDEIKALIEALEILGITTVGGFNGTINLTNFFASSNLEYETNQTTLLSSASMHATISDQLLGLGDNALIVPLTNSDNVAIRDTYQTIDYVTTNEIKAIINALDVLGLSTIDQMSGSFSLAKLDTDEKQTSLLTSASMHATISQKLFDVDDDILFVPQTQEDSVTAVRVLAGPVGFERDFVVKNEIKSLINALIIMGYEDLGGFNAEFELGQIFADPDTVLLSATIQAMFSDRLLNDTGTTLVIPNEYYGTSDDIRIVLVDVTYIEYNELVALIVALDDLGLTDMTNFTFSPANIFDLDDFSTILASEIIQATISKNLLASPTLDETAPVGSARLIVPTYFRQTINVGATTPQQIEIGELDSLLKALKLLEINDFGDSMNSTVITGIFTDVEKRTTFLTSGSMHITTDNMIKGNTHISGSIPNLAKQTKYNIDNVTTKDEIRDFILAANAMASGSFTDVDFSFAAIIGLTPAQQDIILTSMIVRNKITPDVVAASLLPGPDFPFSPFTPPLDNTDYENNDLANFLRKASIQEVIDYYTT